MNDKEKELDELRDKYTMIHMKEHWEDSDFRYSDELSRKIRKLEEELNEN